MKQFLIILVMSFVIASCGNAKVKEYRLEVVAEYPHDTESYTQGLFFRSGQMYESTGQFGQSTFRKVNLNTGAAEERLDFSKEYFVEGSVMFDDNLYILTWTNRKAFIYDAETLKYKSTWKYPREGWGITTDGRQLIASDGSANLYFMDKNFKQDRKVTVKLEDRPVRFLNELEYIDGKIWANVYTTHEILIINPETGVVEGVVSFANLLKEEDTTADTDVFNGIAYDKEQKRIFVTGKNWNKLYEVEIIKR